MILIFPNRNLQLIREHAVHVEELLKHIMKMTKHVAQIVIEDGKDKKPLLKNMVIKHLSINIIYITDRIEL